MNAVLSLSTGSVRAVAADKSGASVLRGQIRSLFDRDFYIAMYPDVAAAGFDPLQHFLECGITEGRSPHPVFDQRFYAAQMPRDRAAEPPFLHYLRNGASNRLDPHPLFDTAHYISQTEAGTLFGQLPLLHFLTTGTRHQLSPNRLFDAAYYRRTNQLGTAHPRHPLLHYIETGWRAGNRTHPLFDPAYYLALRPDVARAGIDPLAHFLRQGFRETASTQEMFDAAHYREAFANDPQESEAIERHGGILHYAMNAGRSLPSPHPLFDREYYAQRYCGRAGSGTERDPFLHFLEYGAQGGHDPHPLFDSAFYTQRYPDIASQHCSAFQHFLRSGARDARDPNALFDAASYIRRHPQASGCAFGALSHYLASATRRTESPSDRFDPVYYADALEAAGEDCGPDPLAHYLAYGRQAGYQALPRPLDQLGWHGERNDTSSTGNLPVLMISPGAGSNPEAICALRAAQQLAADPAVSCHVALIQGGALEHEFASTAPTLILANRSGLMELLHSYRRSAPNGAVLINTATMPDIVAAAARLGLRIIAWLHEMPVAIESQAEGAATMQTLIRHASRIVTVSRHAYDALSSRYGLGSDRLEVLVNGIDHEVREPRAKRDARETAVALREELGIPADALLVLGGGPIEFRRGTDFFIRVAQLTVQRNARSDAGAGALALAHFVWMGEATDRLFSGLCQHDIRQLGLADRVRFVSDPELIKRLLVGADIFLMTSRAEASDNDATQASRNGLSVIAFAGCVDASNLAPGAQAQLVPYLDAEAMSGALAKIGNRPARRRPRTQGAAPPSWAHWYDGLRKILEKDFNLPKQGA